MVATVPALYLASAVAIAFAQGVEACGAVVRLMQGDKLIQYIQAQLAHAWLSQDQATRQVSPWNDSGYPLHDIEVTTNHR
ncbi:hypothetical protein D9M68_850150 [compost metagenome]